MEAYNYRTNKMEEVPSNVIEFLKELKKLYKKYNLSIAHEDDHGSFIIENYSTKNEGWIMDFDLDLEINN